MTTRKQPSIHERLVDVLMAHAEGISITDIRHELNLKPTEHQHLVLVQGEAKLLGVAKALEKLLPPCPVPPSYKASYKD